MKVENRLFEWILREADKTRFLKKAIDAAKENGDIEKALKTFEVTEDELLSSWQDFANKGKADKYKITWDKKPELLFQDLVNDYKDYLDAGGSRSEQKAAMKQNPVLVFEKSGLNVIHENQAREFGLKERQEYYKKYKPAFYNSMTMYFDPEIFSDIGRDGIQGVDMIILDSLETDRWIFVVPMTYEACVFMDSYDCGGDGAQWCLGTKGKTSYWNEYTDDGNLFLLAFSKWEYAKPSGIPDKLKYMLQFTLNSGNIKAWKQSDRRQDTMTAGQMNAMFVHNMNDFVSAIVNAVGYGVNNYTTSGKVFCDNSGYSWLGISSKYELKEMLPELLTSERLDINYYDDNVYFDDEKDGVYELQDIYGEKVGFLKPSHQDKQIYLRRDTSNSEKRLGVVEGVYSRDGDTVKISELVADDVTNALIIEFIKIPNLIIDKNIRRLGINSCYIDNIIFDTPLQGETQIQFFDCSAVKSIKFTDLNDDEIEELPSHVRFLDTEVPEINMIIRDGEEYEIGGLF